MNSKAIEHALKVISRNCSEPAISLEDMRDISQDVVSTGLPGLDMALGVGGIRRGSIVEIFGSESSGKTALALYLAKQYQKNGEAVLYIDAERTLTKETATGAGVEPDNFYILHENITERALQVCESVADTFRLIIIDSFAALCTQSAEIGDTGGATAKITSRAMPLLVKRLAQTGTTLIIINQLRKDVGVLFGNPEKSTGGNAIKFYSSVRLDIRRIDYLKRKGDLYGVRSRIKVIKNKIGAFNGETEFDIVFGQGVTEKEK